MSNPSPPRIDLLRCVGKAIVRPSGTAYLDEACAGNDELRAASSACWPRRPRRAAFSNARSACRGDHDRSPGPANSPAQSSARTSSGSKSAKGAWASVYMAEQTQPVRRKVALKVIKPGMDTPPGHRPLRGRAAGAGDDGPSSTSPASSTPGPRNPAGPTSSWSWSTACRSPSTATTTT